MRHARLLMLPLLLAIGCRETPTSPIPFDDLKPASTTTNVHGITVTPDPVHLVTGGDGTAVATLTYVGPEVTFLSRNPSVAVVTGKVERGQASTTLTIHGVAPGVAPIDYIIPNFARPPGVGTAGVVIVSSEVPKRRAARS